jgi:Pectate lyase superfamily protein
VDASPKGGLRVKKLICLVLIATLVALPGLAASVADFGARGDGVTDDTMAFFKAIAKGGTVVVPKQSGRCYVVSDKLDFADSKVAFLLRPNTTIEGEGGPTICSTSTFVFGNANGHVKIDGLTFEGTGALVLLATKNHQVSGVTFTNNRVQNLTSMAPKGAGLLEWGILVDSLISGNTFQNFWPGGFAANGTNVRVVFPNQENGAPCYNSPDGQACDIGITGISIAGGAARTTISHNKFIQMAADALAINIRPDQLTASSHVDATGLVIDSNEFIQNHRMGIEIGGFGSCHGPNDECDFALVPFNGPIIKGNLFRDPALPYWHTFGYSLVFNGSLKATIINNTATNDNTLNCYGNSIGQGFEHAANSLLFQGNVITSARNACAQNKGWNGYAVLGGVVTQIPQGKAIYENNVVCGAGGSHGFNPETASVPMVLGSNYEAEVCPFGNNTGTSNIVASLSPAQVNQGLATWDLVVVSTLSINHVEFFVDGQLIRLQELSDVNPEFRTTRQWRYHAMVDTTKTKRGSHVLTAVVTDVSGAKKMLMQNFVSPLHP